MYSIAKGLIDRSRTVLGKPTSLADLGYVDVGTGKLEHEVLVKAPDLNVFLRR
jgi:hypothetical protein